MYKVVVSVEAKRVLGKLQTKYRKNMEEAIDSLENNPRPFGYKKLKNYDNNYRIRVGVYRVIYRIEDRELIVEVIKIEHRSKVYR
ncbi:MAG: type II toxin-antitoxin system RelE/ParE family toxin [Dysgonamonadaceae bacterium]|jgi:mRNA interferase RelE/StbE|nr:type II toxin-antitoxin system RelE/ParE family toxin [Dysgonamonadaceae bacterium]